MIMQELPGVCNTFLQRRKLIQVAMASEDCINLLSPGHFKCFVRGCDKVLSLKGWNGLNYIKTHLKKHFDGNPIHSSEGAKMVHRRICHLETTNFITLEENFGKSNRELIAELQISTNDANMSLAMIDVPTLRSGQQFVGAHYEVQMDIMRKLARGDETALHNYVDNQAELEEPDQE